MRGDALATVAVMTFQPRPSRRTMAACQLCPTHTKRRQVRGDADGKPMYLCDECARVFDAAAAVSQDGPVATIPALPPESPGAGT